MRSLTSKHFLLVLGVGLFPSLTSTFGCSSSNAGLFADGGEDGPTAPVATGSMTGTTTGTETTVGTETTTGTGTVIGTETMTGTTTATVSTTGTASVAMTETATETETSSGPPDSGGVRDGGGDGRADAKDDASADGASGSAPTQVCTSGVYWEGLPGPTMDPGDTCPTCHSTFQVAGTVYPTADEPTDCLGVPGGHLSVVITDADGNVQTLTVNDAGNFYSTQKVVFPFHAKVVSPTAERDMMITQSTGDCNYCHSPTGLNGAPGRIMSP